ncbi:MAG: leucine-rich repeat domain-containing protein [Bacteroidales bacterium]|nr:leucine-rich repeat domain-containing protein [Bacteroidales bacterium]
MKKHLLLLFAALLPLVASAEKVEIDGIWYNLVSKAKQAEVTSSGGTKYSGSITIPATVTYDGVAYSVTSIGERAFSNCRSLTAITLPESVTSIGEWAFYYCSSLTAITLPEGVTSIGDYAFYDCRSLTSITIPEGVTSIGDYAFYDCRSLTTITLPESVTSIEFCAFEGCSSLTDVYCHAVTVPSTDIDAFYSSNIGQGTLHVPASAINSYKATAPWRSFGTIVCLTDEETGVEQFTIDNAQMTIYDLHGRRVATPTKDGIYIVDGKKVMVKIGM